jgi:hypothetical protein
MADAYTRLTDTIIPSVWARYQYEESVEKLDIFNAGVLYSDSEITSQLANGGFAVDMPMWNYIPHIPSEAVNDDPTDNIEVKKITSRTERAARNIRAQAWGNMDINRILAGDDPQRIIVQHQAEYWQYANKTTLLAMLSGMVADNVANNGGDLVVDTNASVTELSVIDAAYLMGDQADKFSTLWLHSRQMAALKKLDLIDYVPASQQGGMLLPYYMGLRCIVDDGITGTSGGANLTEYTAYMFKPRAIHWAELPVDTDGGPLEFDRKPRAGHGGGMTETVGRRHFVPHVKGMTLTGTPAGKFATDAEYRTDAFWARATADKKNIGFVALRTTESTPGTA